MSNRILKIKIVRSVRTRTATGGYTQVEAPIPGSPFPARVFRVSQTTISRDEAQPATATLDVMRRLSILNPSAAVQVNDIAYIPSDSAPGAMERAKIIRLRRYSDRVQCDLETGVEQGIV
jgi:hypothetical protein